MNLSPQQQRDYDRASWITNPLRRHQQEKAASLRGSDGSCSLLDASAPVIAEWSVTHKVVVYCESLTLLAGLSDRLTALGVAHVIIDGSDDKPARTDAVTQFRDHQGTRVLLGSKVLEHGLNLQFADVLVSVGLSWNPAREHQREGRLSRMHSPHSVYRHIRFLPNTPQTQKQLATLGNKAADAALVLGA